MQRSCEIFTESVFTGKMSSFFRRTAKIYSSVPIRFYLNETWLGEDQEADIV